MAIDKSDKPLAALFSELTQETTDLIHQEVALARAEMAQKLEVVQAAAISLAIGAVVALAGLFIILQAIVAALAMVLPPEVAPWLSPLIVGVIVAIIGYVMLKGGTAKLSSENLIPQRTIDSLRRDKVVAEEKMR